MRLKRRLDDGHLLAAQFQMSANLQGIQDTERSSGHNKPRNDNI